MVLSGVSVLLSDDDYKKFIEDCIEKYHNNTAGTYLDDENNSSPLLKNKNVEVILQTSYNVDIELLMLWCNGEEEYSGTKHI